jgi:hypothetical protein
VSSRNKLFSNIKAAGWIREGTDGVKITESLSPAPVSNASSA